MREVERLYPELVQRAYRLVVGRLTDYCWGSYKEIAHDITVDFLFFSKSFKETYQSSQGELAPFFASYVRKKLLKVQERGIFYNYMFTKKGMEEINRLSTLDETVNLMELSVALRDAQTYLTEYFSSKINLGRLFRICFVAFLQTGSINHVVMKKRLGCSEGQLKFALAKMRKLLRERDSARGSASDSYRG